MKKRMIYKRLKWITGSLGTVLTILAFAALFFIESRVRTAIVIGILVVYVGLAGLLRYKFWRCPHCGKAFNFNVTEKPEKCSECHELLEW